MDYSKRQQTSLNTEPNELHMISCPPEYSTNILSTLQLNTVKYRKAMIVTLNYCTAESETEIHRCRYKQTKVKRNAKETITRKVGKGCMSTRDRDRESKK